MTETTKIFEDFYQGIAEKYNLCCILFFISEWEDFFCEWLMTQKDAKMLYDGEKIIVLFNEDDVEYICSNFQHVQCPDCLIKALENKPIRHEFVNSEIPKYLTC